MKTLFNNNHNVSTILNNRKNTLFGRPVGEVFARDFFTSPDTNVHEEMDHYILEVAVPGLSRRDITVQVDENLLTVFGQRKNKNNNGSIHEFTYATFQRSFTLPEDANANAINARCRDGLLTIRVDKITATGRRIPVTGDDARNIGPGNSIWKRLAAWWNSVWK